MSSVLVSAHLRERKNAPQPSEVTTRDLCKDRLTDESSCEFAKKYKNRQVVITNQQTQLEL